MNNKFCFLLLLSLSIFSAGCSAQKYPMLDPSDPADNITAWIKLEGDTSGRAYYRYGKMVAWGRPDGEFGQPLFAYLTMKKGKFQKMDNGDYVTNYWECGLYADVQTGKTIDEFVNPYTGKTVKLKPICGRLSTSRYSSETGLSVKASFGLESSILDSPYLLDWRIAGDNVTINREAHTKWVDLAGKTRHEMSLDTFTAKMSELSDPERSSVDATHVYTLVTEWMTMLDMSDIPGSMFWQRVTTKHFDLSEIPDDIQAAFRKEFGDDFFDQAIDLPDPSE